MKLLHSHDYNFDMCRSILIVSMILGHIFMQFYLPDYNRNLTNYATIGFVFLSGFTIGVLYYDRLKLCPHRYIKRLISRTCKLLLIFIVFNIFILLSNKTRLNSLFDLGIGEIILGVFMGTKQALFGFDILIPIAFTSFFSWPLLKVLNKNMSLLLLVVFILLVWFFEAAGIFNYYGIKYLLTGLIGCLLGRLISNLDWDQTMVTLSKFKATLGAGIFIIIYFMILFYFGDKSSPIKVHFHIIPTIIILFFVYAISYNSNLNHKVLIKRTNMTLSNNILFLYIFHIFLINSLFLFIKKDSLNFFATLFLGILFLTFNIIVCYFMDFLNSESIIFSKIYSKIFKL